MNASTTELLRARLQVLQATQLEIEDESHLHAGHAGAKDGGHYKLHIVTTLFTGKNTVARHRLIYDAAGDLMRGRIHALSIQAKTPEEI